MVRMLLPDLVAETGVGVGGGKKFPSSILPVSVTAPPLFH